jgi:hypothetical protein
MLHETAPMKYRLLLGADLAQFSARKYSEWGSLCRFCRQCWHWRYLAGCKKIGTAAISVHPVPLIAIKAKRTLRSYRSSAEQVARSFHFGSNAAVNTVFSLLNGCGECPQSNDLASLLATNE